MEDPNGVECVEKAGKLSESPKTKEQDTPSMMDKEEEIEYSRTGKIITPLDRALDKILHGIGIVTTSLARRPYGMTATWFTRVSNSPYLVIVSVWQKNFTHDNIARSRVYAINILGERERDLATQFGSESGRDVDKFRQVVYRIGKTGSPILYQDAIAYIDCQVVDTMEAGDHTIFLGQVVEAAILSPQDPQVYHRKDYL